MSDAFQPGERLYIDTVGVEFVRQIDPATAIVRVGQDTRAVDLISLSREQ